MKNTNWHILAGACLLMFGLAACQDEDAQPTADANAEFSIQLEAGDHSTQRRRSRRPEAPVQAYIIDQKDTVYRLQLKARGANHVCFKGDPDKMYTLVLIQPGHQRYTREFSLRHLKRELRGKALSVKLAPAFTFTVNGLSIARHAYMIFDFGMYGNYSQLTIDWGDGTQQTVGAGWAGGPHTYADSVDYFVSITGDLDAIEDVRFNYSEGATKTAINVEHLPNLRAFMTATVASSPTYMDLSNNTLLENVNVSFSNVQAVDLPDGAPITGLSCMFNPGFSATSFNEMIHKVYASAVADNRQGGFILACLGVVVPELPFVADPTPQTMEELKDLRENYGWGVLPSEW